MDGRTALSVARNKGRTACVVLVEEELLVRERQALRLTFAMGTHPRSESIVAKLPGDLLRRVAMMALPAVHGRHAADE